MTETENLPPLRSPNAETQRTLLSRWCDWLIECDSLRFGMMSTYVLLIATILIGVSPIEFSEGPRAKEAASIFSWLPELLIRNEIFFFSVRIVLIVSAVLWMLRRWVPVTCWTTVLAALLYWSLRMENLTNGAHIFNVTNNLLIVHAVWFHFYHRKIQSAMNSGGDDRCYPRWVFWVCIFYLGWFHSLAGFSKVACSGLGWGNGISLQLWVDLFGWEGSPFGQLILWNTQLTAWMQTGALVIECASILVIFNRWIRYAIGFGLIGFYLGVLTTFVDFGFHFNAILVVIFLLPVDWIYGLFQNAQRDSEK